MARIDQQAAKQELQKAAECNAQADELTLIADTLRETAREHLREADELLGIRTRSVHQRHAGRS